MVKGVIDMTIWKIDMCPRCGGDIFVDRDMDGWYEECLQCSYRYDLKSTANSEQRPNSKGEVVLSGEGSQVLPPIYLIANIPKRR